MRNCRTLFFFTRTFSSHGSQAADVGADLVGKVPSGKVSHVLCFSRGENEWINDPSGSFRILVLKDVEDVGESWWEMMRNDEKWWEMWYCLVIVWPMLASGREAYSLHFITFYYISLLCSGKMCWKCWKDHLSGNSHPATTCRQFEDVWRMNGRFSMICTNCP